MPWWVWNLIGCSAAIANEYVVRVCGIRSPFTLRYCALALPLVAVLQIGLFYAWNRAPSMMLSWALWSVGTCVMRLVVLQLFIAGEAPNLAVLLGAGLIVAGGWVIKLGL